VTRRDTSAQSDVIAAALAGGATHAEAGQAAGVSERTVRRRLDEPEFLGYVSRLKDELVSRTTDRLTGLTTAAVDTLAELVTSPETPPAVRLRAALGVLSERRVWHDAYETENRLRALEDLLAVAPEEGSP